MNTHILETQDYSEKAINVYRTLGTLSFGEDPPHLRLKNTHILVVRLKLVDEEMIDSLPNLKVIAYNTTGQNHIDRKYAESKGIKCISLLDAESGFLETIPAAAEHAFGLMLAWSRNYYRAFEFPRDPHSRYFYKGHDLKGKILGIIGYGRVGHRVALYARAFGMKYVYTDKLQGFKGWEDVLKGSDFVLLSLPLNGTTEGKFTSKYFEMMKDTACLINISRGEIIREGALLKALWDDVIAGAAVDVLRGDDREPLMVYAAEHDNLIITNHIGGCTVESVEATEYKIAQLVKQHVQSK